MWWSAGFRIETGRHPSSRHRPIVQKVEDGVLWGLGIGRHSFFKQTQTYNQVHVYLCNFSRVECAGTRQDPEFHCFFITVNLAIQSPERPYNFEQSDT